MNNFYGDIYKFNFHININIIIIFLFIFHIIKKINKKLKNQLNQPKQLKKKHIKNFQT